MRSRSLVIYILYIQTGVHVQVKYASNFLDKYAAGVRSNIRNEKWKKKKIITIRIVLLYMQSRHPLIIALVEVTIAVRVEVYGTTLSFSLIWPCYGPHGAKFRVAGFSSFSQLEKNGPLPLEYV